MLPRLRLGLTRRKRLVLGVLRDVSCRARLGVLGLLSVCHAGTFKPNAVIVLGVLRDVSCRARLG